MNQLLVYTVSGGVILAYMPTNTYQRVLLVLQHRFPELSQAFLQTIIRIAVEMAETLSQDAALRVIITNTTRASANALVSAAGALQEFGHLALEAATTTWIKYLMLPSYVRLAVFSSPVIEHGGAVHVTDMEERGKNEPSMGLGKANGCGNHSRKVLNANKDIIIPSVPEITGRDNDRAGASNAIGLTAVEAMTYEHGIGDNATHAITYQNGGDSAGGVLQKSRCIGILKSGIRCTRWRWTVLSNDEPYLCCVSHQKQWNESQKLSLEK